MSDRVRDTETLLEEAIAALRSERPDPELEAGAAARVRQRLEREAGARRSRPVSVDRIRSCDDYQALLPAYLDGSLGDARRLLVEDHLGECISCRRAVKKLRSADAVARREQPAAPSRRWLAVAASALLVMAAAAAVWLADPFGAAATLAQVRATDGSFFRMQPDGAMRLEPGEMVAEGDSLRTAPGAGAVVRLGDGSLVEMRERSEITLAESWGETTVRVARGSVIVEAAPQSQRRLYVATDEFLVAVTGTIFSVTHGTKGSRVSVLEGEVVVEQARHETVLSPGEQLVSRAGVAAVPVAEEVAWSRSEDRYRELLRELEALNQELGRTLASSGLRYSSRLLDLVPPGSDLYLAVPNLSEELFEMHRLFEERLAESPALREWWSRRISGTQTEVEVEDIVARIRDMGDHLGEEIVVTLDLDRPEGGEPLVLAEVDDPAAFAAVLGDEVARLNREIAAARGGGDGDSHGLRIVTDPAAAVAGDGEILLWLAGDVFAAAAGPGPLAELAGAMAAASPFVGSRFHARLSEAYGHGAQWLGGIDLGAVVESAAEGEDAGALRFAGLEGVRHLIAERKSTGGTVHTGAVLTFDGPREAAAAWLAPPAPMGSLDFFSAEADLVAAFVVEDPEVMLAEIFDFVERQDSDFRHDLDAFQHRQGIDVLGDLAAPVGGEMAFGLDGPMLPEPSWKLVMEVYDPARFQQSVEWMVDYLSAERVKEGWEPLVVASYRRGGRTYYRIPVLGEKLVEIHYTFDDGYLVAAPATALVDRALRVRDSRYGIAESEVFQELLPRDGYLNFSAVLFSDLGRVGDTFLRAGAAAGLTEEQRRALEESELMVPSLTCAYGELDQIRLVSSSRGGLLGSRLGALLGLSAMTDLEGPS